MTSPSSLLAELRSEIQSVRFRVLATLLVFMAVGLLVSGAVTHVAQLASLDDRVNEELAQPRKNLSNLVKPARGSPGFDSLDELFTLFLRAETPGGHESLMTMVRDGNTILPVSQPTNLQEQEVRDQIWAWSRSGETVVRDTEIDGRAVRLSITSVTLAGRPGEGLLVVSSEIGRQRDEVVNSMWINAAAALATLAAAGVAGYMVTGQLLGPIRRLREATQNTTFEDLTKRVEVPETTDDVALLAMNFNHMLERLESGFDNQRRFVHDASHELRTPMTVIRGYLELLRAGDPDDVNQTRVLLLDELDRMQVLVEDLLILARSDRPDFVSPEWIEADIFLENVLNRVKVLGPRQWQLDTKPGGLIRADRHRLTQALEQLAANALKYTTEEDRISFGAAWAMNDDGGAPLGARPRPSTDLEIWVSDTGSGIPAEDHERIFERFGKGRNSGSEGSGLGLSIVKAIVVAHGGTVRLESDVGKGSRFVLRIPSGGGDGPSEEITVETTRAQPPKRAHAPNAKPRVTGPSSGAASLSSAGGTP
ncbi:cell wall metabolism sensor histidine kinase WalK [Arthrobacter sp. ISL-28]|uniref:sensor histidine kinase n=1 Tax=Arthrobacter sp. ISL-28 TaxID=2819108 RepID=UPI001BEB271B|nr:HAMP domain-containing sensor histidine kinase [Arthrobacter sp. ISL-28]MBT2519596.1 HAMP domain-containing histidine kinase [Arthrobacter sp. ISL-28]